jgi:hypothetical protein
MAPSAYLDNCISPTGVVREQLPQGEGDALNDLNRLEAVGLVELYTSDLVKTEIARTPLQTTADRLEALHELYERISARG